MNHLDDELDVRYHRGKKPDVYYRCPSLESLDGAFRNELQKSSAGIIPVEIVAEFIFSAASTITIPAAQQRNLEALIVATEFAQSITVDQALCREVEGLDRVKAQRAIARSIVDLVESIDGFKYTERQAWGKDNDDGTRFKYVCTDSLQNRERKANAKRGQEGYGDHVDKFSQRKKPLPTYDCGGAFNIRFSIKRGAVNVVYKHNPIHRDVDSRPMDAPLPPATEEVVAESSKGDAPKKRKRTKKAERGVDEFGENNLDMSTSPGVNKASTKEKGKKNSVAMPPNETQASSTGKSKKAKPLQSPSKPRSSNKASISEPAPAPAPKIVNGPCMRCKEKQIKCNEAKPTCDQCRRGLWGCQYQEKGAKKRSKSGCFNCRQRKRKCTEEKPHCAYCLKVDDDCEYPDYA